MSHSKNQMEREELLAVTLETGLATLVAQRLKRLPTVRKTWGNGNPLQYSCLENPMDGGTWWATVHGVAKSGTLLSDFTSS